MQINLISSIRLRFILGKPRMSCFYNNALLKLFSIVCRHRKFIEKYSCLETKIYI